MMFAPFFKSLKVNYDIHFFKKWIKQAFLTTVALGGIFHVVFDNMYCVINVTESLPYRFFILLKPKMNTVPVLKKDVYVSFFHPFVGMNVIKQVKGISGSRIRYDKHKNMWVDDFFVGKVREESRKGEPLLGIKDGIIPEGFIFVYAPHEKSFDSRYRAFGLVPLKCIKGFGVPIV